MHTRRTGWVLIAALILVSAVEAQDSGSAASATAAVHLRVRVLESLTVSFGATADPGQPFREAAASASVVVKSNLARTTQVRIVSHSAADPAPYLLATLSGGQPAVPEVPAWGLLPEPPWSGELRLFLPEASDGDSGGGMVEVRVIAY